MIRFANAETKMDMGWIAVGGLTVGLIGWCIPRPAERAAIASYPKGVVGRLMLPFSDWEDHVAGSDIETVRGLRRRVAIGGLVASAAAAGAGLWFDARGGDTYIDNGSDSEIEVRKTSPATPPSIVDVESEALPSPTALTAEAAVDPEEEQKPETLEEKRQQIRLFSTAKVKPIYRLHDVEGARLTRIQPGSFWDMLGVQEGDVVIELHGSPVNTPAMLVELMNVLESDEHVAIRVRGLDGEVRYLEFRVPR